MHTEAPSIETSARVMEPPEAFERRIPLLLRVGNGDIGQARATGCVRKKDPFPEALEMLASLMFVPAAFSRMASDKSARS